MAAVQPIAVPRPDTGTLLRTPSTKTRAGQVSNGCPFVQARFRKRLR